MNAHRNTVTGRLAGLVLLVVALASGCAAPFDDDADQRGEAEEAGAMKLLAKLSVNNGNTVEFYDDGVSDVIVSETGPIENSFSFTNDDLALRTPVELWTMAGGSEAEIPQLLREVTARRDQQRSQIGTTRQAFSSGVKFASCADAETFAEGGPHVGGTIGTRAKSDTDLVYDKNYYRFTLCVYGGQTGGTVSMDAYVRPWWDWNKKGYWVTSPGYFRWWAHDNSSTDFDARTRFWNGAGLKIDAYTNCMPSGYNCWN